MLLLLLLGRLPDRRSANYLLPDFQRDRSSSAFRTGGRQGISGEGGVAVVADEKHGRGPSFFESGVYKYYTTESSVSQQKRRAPTSLSRRGGDIASP